MGKPLAFAQGKAFTFTQGKPLAFAQGKAFAFLSVQLIHTFSSEVSPWDAAHKHKRKQ